MMELLTLYLLIDVSPNPIKWNILHPALINVRVS